MKIVVWVMLADILLAVGAYARRDKEIAKVLIYGFTIAGIILSIGCLANSIAQRIMVLQLP